MSNSRPPRRPRGRSGSSNKAARPKAEELHPVDEVPDIKSFRELALAEDIQEAIAAMGITEPTPIQKLAISPVLEGRDVIAKAETGTGKTLAFGAPMMSRIEADRASVLGLVLCPTRELALQVYEVVAKLGEPRGVKVALVVGGDPMHPQVEALRDGAQVVVGTPGRVLDLAKQRFLSFPWTEFAVLDEADEMLEIGFIDDVRKILDMCSEDRQTLLFSATFPPELLRLARDHTKNPIEVATAKGVASVENITHYVTQVDEHDRDSTLKRLIHATADDDVLLVFCDRRVEVERVLRALERTRLNVKALHGGYDQAARTRVMSAFRDGSVKVLVATDVASRGLDIKHVTHVINLSVPRSISAYTHRSGRTGRAGRTGAALTVVVPSDKRRWRELESQMTWPVVDFDERQRNAAKESGSEEPGRRERSRSRRETRDDEGGRESRPRRRERSRRPSDEREAATETNTRDERPRRSQRSRRPSDDSEARGETQSREERPKRGERSRRSRDESESRNDGDSRESRPRRSERSRRPSRDEESQSETTSRESRPRRGTRSRRPSDEAETQNETTERESRPRRGTRSRRPRDESDSRSDETPRESRPRRGSRSRRPSDEAETQHQSESRESRPRRSSRTRESREESTPPIKMPVRHTRRSEHERRHREMEQAAAELNAQSEQKEDRESARSPKQSERPRRARRSKRTSETRGNDSESERSEERSPRESNDGDRESRSEDSRPRRKTRSSRSRTESDSSSSSDSPRRAARSRSETGSSDEKPTKQRSERPRRAQRSRRSESQSSSPTETAEAPTPPKPRSSGGGFGAGI